MTIGHERDMARATTTRAIAACGAVLLLVATTAIVTARSAAPTFVTWQGIGPDKWASTWLLLRHVDPDAEFEFIPVGSSVRDGMVYDMPGSDLFRDGDSTVFGQLIDAYAIDDPRVTALASVVHDMEIGRWGLSASAESRVAEQAFRQLQRVHGRESVPFGCYIAFFDRLADVLVAGAELGDPALLEPEAGCETVASGRLAPTPVVEIPPDVILERIARGERVVFLDVREPGEYVEYHIPGARNVQLRYVDEALADSLHDADLVVPYCVKDFRGYEVARALNELGLEQVAIMNPFGIRGWVAVGLPIAGEVGMDEPSAVEELHRCAAEPYACLTNDS